MELPSDTHLLESQGQDWSFMSNRKWELMAPRSNLHGVCTTSLPLYVGDRVWSALATN